MEHTLTSRRRRFGCIAALAVIVGARYDGATLTAWGPLLPGDRQRNAHQRRGDVRTPRPIGSTAFRRRCDLSGHGRRTPRAAADIPAV